MTDAAPAHQPRIRIVDAVATGDTVTGLTAADDRLVEFTLGELERLVRLLGGEGLEALCAYLRVLRKDTGPDGRPTLLVEEFSGAWVQAHTSLGRNAAYRAQRTLEDTGLLVRVSSRPGQGARGKQRACLNPALVTVPGGADSDVSSLTLSRPGRPVSRTAGNRRTGGMGPVCEEVGNRETGHGARFPGRRETTPTETASAQVSAPATPPGTRLSTAATSSEYSSVVQQLLSTDAPGLVATTLVPAAHRHRQAVTGRLTTLLNSTWVADRLDPLAEPLGLTGPRTGLVAQLAGYLVDLLTGTLDPVAELARLHVAGPTRIPADQVAERLVVGIVVGLGMDRPVSRWGGWLHQVTRPGWSPKPNRLLERFTVEVERLAAGTYAAPPAPPTDPTRHEPGAAAASRTAGGVDLDEVELPVDVVEEHYPAAAAAYPHLCRGIRAQSPAYRMRAVRIYLRERDLLRHAFTTTPPEPGPAPEAGSAPEMRTS